MHLAQYFANANIATFPVKYTEKKQKVPMVTDWQNLPPNTPPTKAHDWGFVIPDWMIVVDVDQKRLATGKEVPGLQSWEQLKSMLNAPLSPVQIIVQTASGARHFFFSKPDSIMGQAIKKTNKLYPGIEFLSKGCYAVGPGTHFEDTPCPYVVIQGDLNALASTDSITRHLYLPEFPEELLHIIEPYDKREKAIRQAAQEFHDGPVTADQYKTYLTRTPAPIEGDRNNTTYQVMAKGRDMGLSQELNLSLAAQHYAPRCLPPLDEYELSQIAENVYKYAQKEAGEDNVSKFFAEVTDDEKRDLEASASSSNLRWNYNSRGEKKPNDWDNVVNYLMTPDFGTFENPLYKMYRWNLFAQHAEYASEPPWPDTDGGDRSDGGRRITDSEIMELRRYLSQKFSYVADDLTIVKAVEHVARQYSYHPVKQWLKSLVWDGVPRMDDWLTEYAYIEDTPFTRAASAKVLLGAVTRIFQPGKKWDTVLIIEGAQGVAKGEVVRALAVRPEWFASAQMETDKDSRMVMSSKWIIELAEFQGVKGGETNAVKAFLTTERDTYRAPYARTVSDYPRQSICIATVNPDADGRYLHDLTNRRYWPVEMPYRLTPDELAKLRHDVPQLYAEAMQRYYKNEERLYLEGEAEREAYDAVKRRVLCDAYVDVVSQWFDRNPDVEGISLVDLWIRAMEGDVNHYGKRQKADLLKACAFLNCDIYGPNKDKVRQPGSKQKMQQEKLPPKTVVIQIQEIRKRLTDAAVYNMDELLILITGELEPCMSQAGRVSLGRHAAKIPGVTPMRRYVPGTKATVERCYRIEPLPS